MKYFAMLFFFKEVQVATERRQKTICGHKKIVFYCQYFPFQSFFLHELYSKVKMEKVWLFFNYCCCMVSLKKYKESWRKEMKRKRERKRERENFFFFISLFSPFSFVVDLKFLPAKNKIFFFFGKSSKNFITKAFFCHVE